MTEAIRGLDEASAESQNAGGPGARGLGVECRKLSKSFPTRGGSVQALDDLSFRIAPGEFVSILGPSGCGKTTLLRILAGLLPASSGELVFSDGADVGRPRIALAFQEHGLLPWMTVLDNVAFALDDRRLGWRTSRERARAFVAQVGLEAFADLYPGQLSRGMRQRVNIARAFARDPQLLLLDEPFASLDAQSRRILQQELLGRWQQHPNSVLFITHDIEEAILLADRVLLMTGTPGRILEELPVDLPRPRDLEAWESPSVRELRRYLWQALAADTRRRLALEEKPPAERTSR